MKNEDAFFKFLKRNGRSPEVAQRVIQLVVEFDQFLQTRGKNLDQSAPSDLEAFVGKIEAAPKASAKTHLWAIIYYYNYTANEVMRRATCELRGKRTASNRVAFQLRKFHGVNPEYTDRLAAIGIKDVEQMLQAGCTPTDRKDLSEKTGVPLDAILEFVKLSDLSRVGAIKGIRARLYYDAGVETPEKFAQWDPKELRAMLVEFVERTGFDGIAPLPKEVQNGVTHAKIITKIVEYE